MWGIDAGHDLSAVEVGAHGQKEDDEKASREVAQAGEEDCEARRGAQSVRGGDCGGEESGAEAGRETKEAVMAATAVVTPRLMQLYALRQQLDALIMAEEMDVASSAPDPNSCQQCGAPEDKTVDGSTMGHKRKVCTACGAEWNA